MTEDIIEHIQGSLIQHGHHNNRIYLMALNVDHPKNLIAVLDEMAQKNAYGKIFAKIPASCWTEFKAAGYEKEAVVPGLFRRKTDAYFIAKYFSAKRRSSREAENMLEQVRQRIRNEERPSFQAPVTLENIDSCQPSDAGEMSSIYRQVYKSYPFPIHTTAFLESVMNSGNLFFCKRVDGKIAALAAAEIDLPHQAAEMTDFATVSEWRGRGFASSLLRHLHCRVRDKGIQTAFTIARASSRGMNSVFEKCGYQYAGLLKNNSQICGSIQSMTVWYKHL